MIAWGLLLSSIPKEVNERVRAVPTFQMVLLAMLDQAWLEAGPRLHAMLCCAMLCWVKGTSSQSTQKEGCGRRPYKNWGSQSLKVSLFCSTYFQVALGLKLGPISGASFRDICREYFREICSLLNLHAASRFNSDKYGFVNQLSNLLVIDLGLLSNIIEAVFSYEKWALEPPSPGPFFTLQMKGMRRLVLHLSQKMEGIICMLVTTILRALAVFTSR